MEHYDEFDQYLRASEPASKERAGIWQTAIGLQKVDGLDVSDFLVETAKRHIEGEIDIDTVRQLKNRYLHVRWDEVNKTNCSSQERTCSSQESSQEAVSSSQESSEHCPLDNRDKVLVFLRSNPNITLQEIADKIGITRRGVQKITDRLKSDGIIRREGSTKAGKWIINKPD